MQFTKMHGLGNDFVVVAQESVNGDFSSLAKRVCDRHTGVGADGLVFLTLSPQADLKMRIFNADGTEAEQCGNAIRCVAKYFYERISSAKESLLVETNRGLQPVWLEVEKGEVQQVRVDMGKPILSAEKIPVVSQQKHVVQEKIEVEDEPFQYTAVSMGNPHIVIGVEDTTDYPVEKWGPLLETHANFPRKTNVEFITIHSRSEVTMRVWERGVGETLACGSGACAVLVAGVLEEKLNRQATIHLLGGDLLVEWDEQDDHVYMTGSATMVYDGHWLDS